MNGEMTEIKEKILEQLRQETEPITTKELISKLGAKRVNARKIGRWLTREAPTLGIEIFSKYGHNHYKLKTSETSPPPEQPEVQEPSMVKNIFESLKTMGIDVRDKLHELRQRKLKELDEIDKVIANTASA